MTYKKLEKGFWTDDAGVIWMTVDLHVSDWSYELQKVNCPGVVKRVHGSKFE